jgi:hypothetical protein
MRAYLVWGTILRAGRSWDRIPMTSLTFFNLHNASRRTTTLEFTEFLTEMSTRNVLSKPRRALKATTQPSVSRLSRKYGILVLSEPYPTPRRVTMRAFISSAAAAASMVLYLYCLVLADYQFTDLIQSVGLPRRRISKTQSLYLNAGQRRINPVIHTSNKIRTHDLNIWRSEDTSCVRPRGYPDLFINIHADYKLNFHYTNSSFFFFCVQLGHRHCFTLKHFLSPSHFRACGRFVSLSPLTSRSTLSCLEL